MYNLLKNEGGFWSAVFILTLTALATLSLVSYIAVRYESHNVVNQRDVLQADYAATSGAFYAIKSYVNESLSNAEIFTLGTGDTIFIEDPVILSSHSAHLTIRGKVNNAEKQIELDLSVPSPWWDNAVTCEDSVDDNIFGRDDAGNVDNSLIVEGVENMPDLDTTTTGGLRDPGMCVDIAPLKVNGNETYPDTTTGLFCPGNPYFWADCTTPLVTYVEGDFSVGGNAHAGGILLVNDGDVTLHGGCYVHGVIILLTDDKMVFKGNDPDNPHKDEDASVTGGIISWGDVEGSGKNIYIQHDSTFMDPLRQFDNTNYENDYRVVWQYK